MTQICLICNVPVGPTGRNATNIFGEIALSSKKKLSDVLSEIVKKTLKESTIHSKIICKKCYKFCTEYDSIKTRLEFIQTVLLNSFKNSLPQHNLNYSTYEVPSTSEEAKRLVLPASKLKPLPPNFVINMNQFGNKATGSLLQGLMKKVDTQPKIIIQKPTNCTSMPDLSTTANSPIKTIVSTHSLTLPTKMTDTISSDKITSIAIPRSTPSPVKSTKNPILSFNVNSLPKDFLTTVLERDEEAVKKEARDGVNRDEQHMEIDEECGLVVNSTNTDNSVKLSFEDKRLKQEPSSSFFDMNMLLSPGEGHEKYILDKLEIMSDDDDDDQQTIVMDSGSGTTIIRMAAGQKVLYDGTEFSVVRDDDGHVLNNDDSHDSNDESQIELQVSGDEETANAIIAAAKEQGGAFIKVESGEMFQVKSVQSKSNDDQTDAIQDFVEKVGELYRCLLCEKNKNVEPKQMDCLREAETIMAHLKTIHSARIYICQICGQVMRKRTEYTAHIEEHAQKGKGVSNKSKLHSCGVCARKYNSRTLLAEHMNVHAGARPYSCAVCQKTFSSKYTHQAHLKTHAARPRPFKCDICHKSFFTQQNLNQHEKTHTGVKEFICKVCDKAFATQHNLEVHGVTHTGRKPFKCVACGKGFARRAEVRDHMRIHTGERPFACDVCGATFTQRSNLHSHKRATHLDDKRYHCDQCSKRFKRRRLLDYHIKAAHTGERPLKCEICKATFVYPEHYKKHIRIHSGEKPYVCEVCGKSFNSRDNRNTHRFVHSDKKPYECLACGAGYMRKQLLYAHMTATGHVAESIVVNQPRVISGTDAIFETTAGELELDGTVVSSVAVSESDAAATKLFIADDKTQRLVLHDKSAINLVQETDDPTFLTLHNLNGLIEASTEDKLEDQAQIVTTDEKGNTTMRLIQVQLADGKSGWVAINN